MKKWAILLVFLVGCSHPVEEEELAPSLEQKEEAPLPSVLKESSTPASKTEEIPSKVIPRTVIALWDSVYEKDVNFTAAHKLTEMPLNYLGAKIEFVDLQKPLPDLSLREDVIGVLCWLPDRYKFGNLNALVNFGIKTLDSGKKFVLIGVLTPQIDDVPIRHLSEFWDRIGIYMIDSWSSLTYNSRVSYADPELIPFEASVGLPLASFVMVNLTNPKGVVHLAIESKIEPRIASAVVVTTPQGGFALSEYIIYQAYDGESFNQKWIVNPFKFFKISFGLEGFPIPDPSTLAGRRAYYSHIDGDGWNNESTVVRNKTQDPLWSSEVILKEVIEAYPDLPVTIGPIAANLNADWLGSKKSDQIAENTFKVPHVEAGCHTYSHPFDWQFFKNYTTDKERPYLSRYPNKTWKSSSLRDFLHLFNKQETFYKTEEKALRRGQEAPEAIADKLKVAYFVPRAYAVKPFDLKLEVLGAIREVNLFTPSTKKVEIYQWSGDTLPWEEAVELTKKAGVANINGGDPRFDFMNPSYAYVAPLARVLGNQIQVYTSSSNENLYTDLWTKNFYGLVTLPTTFIRTELPLRVKAMNLYYHMYSGEKLPSLYALFKNLSYIRTQEITPIQTSLYAKMVDGFYSSHMTPMGTKQWLIEDRGELETFRYEAATFLGVDFEKSVGIVGARHSKGSLYVYLDASLQKSVIALKELEESDIEPVEKTPYLIESRWRIWDLKKGQEGRFSFISQGYGEGEMSWKVPFDAMYQITITDGPQFYVPSDQNELRFSIKESALSPLEIEIREVSTDGS